MRQPNVVLTGEETAMVRQVLLSCSHLLAWAGAHAGPAWHQAVPEITAAAGCGRTAGNLYYEASLAVDCLDSAAGNIR